MSVESYCGQGFRSKSKKRHQHALSEVRADVLCRRRAFWWDLWRRPWRAPRAREGSQSRSKKSARTSENLCLCRCFVHLLEGQQLKIGFYCYDGFMEASPACVRAVHKAVAALKRAGVCCVEFCPPDVEEAFLIYAGLLATGLPHVQDLLARPGEHVADAIRKGIVAFSLPMWLKVLVTKLAGAPVMEKVVRMARAWSGAEYYELVAAKMRYMDKFAKAFTSDLDLLLSPVHVLPTSAHMTTKDFPPTVCYTALQNLLDYPAGVVPVTTLQPSDSAWDSPIRDKLLDPPIRRAYAQAIEANAPFPIGVQLVGRPYTEELVVRGMRELETALRAPQSLL
ncbi:unnamed protein product [Prorocentrum cordatum]|uniref:Amidase domain-containing protein n=1 Tax=Prorocentrum cordatum TaxID=2364126 RepID=A0ABN9QGB1_9DINO|nr:unnamed protein product [Polarella glacialis]